MEYFKYLNNIACIDSNHEEILKMMQNILHALFFTEQTFLRYTTKYIIIGHPADGDFKQVISQSTIQIKNEN